MILLIDNYDSFTYNLVQYFMQMDDNVIVYRNDQISINQIEQLDPTLIVLSPGPGTPKESGISSHVLQRFYEQIPILGVCLGHQVIIDFFGGKIIKGKQPMHGKVTTIEHNSEGIYHQIPSPTQVTRYHSLIASEQHFPNELNINAWSEDGVIMGVCHHHLPIFGIQFHPESIRTTNGFQLLKNCFQQATKWKKGG